MNGAMLRVPVCGELLGTAHTVAIAFVVGLVGACADRRRDFSFCVWQTFNGDAGTLVQERDCGGMLPREGVFGTWSSHLRYAG